MSDEHFRAEIILHCPEGLIRDVTEMVPPGVSAGAMNIGMFQSLARPSRVWGSGGLWRGQKLPTKTFLLMVIWCHIGFTWVAWGSPGGKKEPQQKVDLL